MSTNRLKEVNVSLGAIALLVLSLVTVGGQISRAAGSSKGPVATVDTADRAIIGKWKSGSASYVFQANGTMMFTTDFGALMPGKVVNRGVFTCLNGLLRIQFLSQKSTVKISGIPASQSLSDQPAQYYDVKFTGNTMTMHVDPKGGGYSSSVPTYTRVK